MTGRVKTAFDEHGVEIPYPKRDIYVRTAGDEGPPERSAETLASGRSDGAAGSSASAESTQSDGEPSPPDER